MSLPFAYLGIVLIWSTTPLAIQWSAQGAGFAFAVLARMAVGVLLAVLLLAVGGVRLPLHRRARASYLVSGLGLFGAMVLTYWSAGRIPSGLISVLFGLTPLISGLLASQWLEERPLTLGRVAGMLLGVAGLALIFLRGSGLGGPEAPLGLAALLLAVLLHSASLVGIKRIGDDSPPLATTLGSLTVALPLFALVWLVAEGHLPEHLDLRAGAAILYLGVFGSVLGFALYYHLLQRMEAGQVALIPLLTPVVALLLGQAMNGERVGVQVWAGSGLIVGGLVLHQWEGMRCLVRRWR